MRRSALGVDRVVVLVAAVVGIVAGVVAVAWVSGLVRTVFGSAPASVDLNRGYASVLSADWWRWVSLGGGVVFVVLGLWWFIGHLRVTSVHRIQLPGSAPSGELTADTGAVTGAAGKVLQATPGVRSGSASLRTDRGQLVLALDAVVGPDADLRLLSAAAVRTAGEVAAVTELDGLYARGRVTVASRG